jgi:uncharacterized protein YkwD
MSRKRLFSRIFYIALIPVLLMAFPSNAEAQEVSPSDVISAVNSLRVSQGLQPFVVDNALMASAQGQSDYQAQLGYWTHEGPGGTSPRDRAIAVGFGGGATVFVG